MGSRIASLEPARVALWRGVHPSLSTAFVLAGSPWGQFSRLGDEDVVKGIVYAR